MQQSIPHSGYLLTPPPTSFQTVSPLGAENDCVCYVNCVVTGQDQSPPSQVAAPPALSIPLPRMLLCCTAWVSPLSGTSPRRQRPPWPEVPSTGEWSWAAPSADSGREPLSPGLSPPADSRSQAAPQALGLVPAAEANRANLFMPPPRGVQEGRKEGRRTPLLCRGPSRGGWGGEGAG